MRNLKMSGPIIEGPEGEAVDLTEAQALYKDNQAKKKKKTGSTSKYKTEVSPEYEAKYLKMNPGAIKGKDYGYSGDKKESVSQEKENLLDDSPVDKVASTKKGGTLSYDDAWKNLEDEGRAKYSGDKTKFVTAAKAWNKSKYGTTEPLEMLVKLV